MLPFVRHFTPDEANAALEHVRPLVERLVAQRAEHVAALERQEELERKIRGNGGGIPPAQLADAAAELVGEANVNRAQAPAVASEDFAFMLERIPGAYINLGNGASAPVHNHRYNFNDEAIPFGAALYARLVERQLPRGSEA